MYGKQASLESCRLSKGVMIIQWESTTDLNYVSEEGGEEYTCLREILEVAWL